MAHEIAFVNGRFSFARHQNAGKAWHEGETMTADQIILPTDSREEVLRKSGLHYTIESRPIFYRPTCDKPQDGQPMPSARIVSGKVVQARSDNGADLGIVSPTFKTVQPFEAYDIAQEWVGAGGGILETMFALHGGRVYGALFAIGEAVHLDGKRDTLKPYIYWSTACDGSRKTKIKDTVTRVECANTDAMTHGDSAAFSLSHRSIYKAQDARDAVECALSEFGAYVAMARDLARVKMDSVKAAQIVESLVGPEKTDTGRKSSSYARIMALFQGAGQGADLDTARGTAWGLLNAVTDYVDHDARSTTPDNRFDSAQDGAGAKLKAQARDLILAA